MLRKYSNVGTKREQKPINEPLGLSSQIFVNILTIPLGHGNGGPVSVNIL